MSQFPVRYKRPNYERKEYDDLSLQKDFDGRIWKFWRLWGLFEYLVLGLLAAILLALLTLLLRVKNTKVVVLHDKQIEYVKQQQQQSSVTKNITVPTKSTYILPKNPLPPQVKLGDKIAYGPIRFLDYIYFADEMGLPHPKTAGYKDVESPLHGVNNRELQEYLNWINLYTSSNLKLKRVDDKFYLFKGKKCF